MNLVGLVKSSVEKTCQLWNLYGPAEATLVATYHPITSAAETRSIPIGRPLPGYSCVILDDFSQPVFVGQEGELLVGGVGVFAGYLGRDDLTKKALVEIDGQVFYRTGDLVRFDSNGLLYYGGRKDHQIKLRGQRIELGEIERCLLDVSSKVSGCVVVKWGEDHLVAYVQSDDMEEKQLREHCRSHLAPFMVPSMFIVLEQLPLNANGKLDRKRLPTPNFLTPTDINDSSCFPLTELEERLVSVFAQAFHVESPNVNASFGQLGGTSLDAIVALSMIREQVCKTVGIGLLYENPSVRELSRVLEPLLVTQEEVHTTLAPLELKDNHRHPMPSLVIEALGVLFLVFQWLSPIWVAYCSKYRLAFLLVPVLHLLLYVVCQRLLLWPGKELQKVDALYSWCYYRFWFLERLWSINNSYWLQHLLGTPFYNTYLRLCGARIGRGAHIYSTSIDAPWLLDVGESTFIDDETIFSNSLYFDQTYELHSIRIGSHCSIGTRCVLYGEVNMGDYVHIEPMSRVTGNLSPTIEYIPIKDRSFSHGQIIYQLTCLLCLLVIHVALLYLTSLVYQFCSAFWMPTPISLAVSWFFWITAGLFIVVFLLKFIVGHATPGNYPVNSYYYLHRLWLRQLLISTFRRSYEVLPSYDAISNVLLRWLGADIEDDVKLAQFQSILRFPSNLLKIQRGATTFARATLIPFEMTREGDCCLDTITLGSGTNIANACISPGIHLGPNTIVGNLTLVTRETHMSVAGAVLLGIPARQMPFVMPEETKPVHNVSLCGFPSLLTPMSTCLIILIGKCLFITIYWLLPAVTAPFVHAVLFCAIYHCTISQTRTKTTFTFSERVTRTYQFLGTVLDEFIDFISPFLSRTQYLILLFRALGARIGRDVILPDIYCLPDPHLVTIGDHVRLSIGACIQVIRRCSVLSF